MRSKAPPKAPHCPQISSQHDIHMDQQAISDLLVFLTPSAFLTPRHLATHISLFPEYAVHCNIVSHCLVVMLLRMTFFHHAQLPSAWKRAADLPRLSSFSSQGLHCLSSPSWPVDLAAPFSCLSALFMYSYLTYNRLERTLSFKVGKFLYWILIYNKS